MNLGMRLSGGTSQGKHHDGIFYFFTFVVQTYPRQLLGAMAAGTAPSLKPLASAPVLKQCVFLPPLQTAGCLLSHLASSLPVWADTEPSA